MKRLWSRPSLCYDAPMKRISLVFSLICLAPSLAADPAPSGRKAVECYCTDRNGQRVELGQTICLDVNGRRFAAQCQMSLNVPMWRDIGEACPGLAQRLDPDLGQNLLQTLGVHTHI